LPRHVKWALSQASSGTRDIAIVGVGGNALVGGWGETFVLQPISVQAQEGLNLAVGLSSFELWSLAD
jgi:hypothetical protein